MLRAIFFDFYGVWTPDRFAEYTKLVEKSDQASASELREVIKQYYFGLVDIEHLVNKIKFSVNDPNISLDAFKLRESDLSLEAIKFIQYLHSHFIKVGILANLGAYEHDLLTKFNENYKLFETITDSYILGKPLLTKEVFVKAFQEIGEPIDSCLIITGNDEYQEFAESLGIKTYRYNGFSNLKSVISDLLEFDKTTIGSD